MEGQALVLTMRVIINLFSYWTRAYYCRNFNLLTQVKGKYDSENIFRFPQSIPPTTECD
ncbi:BBE domain-containing protein [Clostridium botulinum]|nr:BBE domain-containing protein [Clostridium botulinum]